MLSDLVHGARPSSEPTASTGLSGLIAGAAARPMSLPAAMNALRRGELERPVDGAIGEVLSPDMPALRPQPYRGEVDEAELRARADQLEMRNRIQAKRRELEATEYTRDVRSAVADAQRKHEIRQRLDKAEAQLSNGETDG